MSSNLNRKAVFLEELERLLSELPERERQDIVIDFAEHFREAQERGRTEEETIQSLGSVQAIAEEIVAEYRARPIGSNEIASEPAVPLHDWIEREEAAIQLIDIHARSVDVIVESHKSDRIECWLSGNDDEDLELKQYVEGSNYKIVLIEKQAKRFFNLFKLPMHRHLTVKIPETYAQSVAVELNSGDVELNRLTADRLEIRANSGDIEVRECVWNTVRIQADSGDVELKRLTAREMFVGTNSGDLEIEYIQAKQLHVGTDSGDLEGSHLECGRIDLNVNCGDVELSHISGQVMKLEVNSGDVELEKANIGEITVSAVSGDIELERVYGYLQVTAVSGDIELAAEPGTSGSIQATSGDIEICFTGGAYPLQIDAHAQSGDVDVELPRFMAERSTDNSYKGRYGTGGSLLSVRTASGDISISEH